jgi:AcrR family transcriptional regulator
LISQEESMDRRTEILEAACRVIARDGAHGLRMADVAREAGVSNALVHYYVPTRQELLAEAFDFANTRAEQELEDRLPADAPAAERLEAALTVEFEDGHVVRESWALWNELWSAALHDPSLRPRVERAYRRWLATIEALVREAGSAADPVATTERLAALVDGLGSKVLIGILSPSRASELLRAAIDQELGVPHMEVAG